MTLRRQLAWRYALVAGVCLSLLGGLAYHQLVTEPRHRKAVGIRDLRDTVFAENTELAFYLFMPLVLLGGWEVLRRTLLPLRAFSELINHSQGQDPRVPLPPLTGAEEVDQAATAVVSARAHLHEWSQRVRQFTLHASHELKTPLTVMGIQFETMLQEQKDLSPQQVEWMECQLDEIQRLGKIVDALTLLTKADAGLFTVECRPLELGELVRESYEDAQFLAEPNCVTVTLAECSEASLAGDRHRLRQLLLNLVDNAIKYNRPGGMVTMALRRAEGAAELEITNTGSGIPPGMQTRVFERFIRGDEARSRAVEGSGLGLSICKLIVEAHGGTLRLLSEPGKLTTVHVRLPLARKQKEAPGMNLQRLES
jgi:signal transduction histidine kinase